MANKVEQLKTMQMVLTYSKFVIKAVNNNMLDIAVDSDTGLYAKSCNFYGSFVVLSEEEQQGLPEEMQIDYKTAYCMYILSKHIKSVGDNILKGQRLQSVKGRCLTDAVCS